METENAVIEAAEFEIGKCALLLALRGQAPQVRRVSIPLQPDEYCTVAEVLGSDYLTQLPGRAVRIRVDGGTVADIGNIVADRWLKGQAQAEGAAALEMDPRNEP